MSKKTIFIRKGERFPGKYNTGARIINVGFADLTIRALELGTRLKPATCGSSAVVDYSSDTILVVRIGNADYKLEPLQFSNRESDKYGDTADAYGCRFQVTIPSDADVMYREPDQFTQNEVIQLLPPAIN